MKYMTDDAVDHPSHYCKGPIEVIDCIDSLITGRDPRVAYALGNAVKYIARAGDKDPSKFDEDLDKAIWYINHAKKVHVQEEQVKERMKWYEDSINGSKWKDIGKLMKPDYGKAYKIDTEMTDEELNEYLKRVAKEMEE